MALSHVPLEGIEYGEIMNIVMKKLGFSRFESLLGLGLMAVIVLVVLPPLRGGMLAERPLRAAMEAEMVARAVLDYHTDMGSWPVGGDGQTDLALLVPMQNRARTRAMAGTMNSATNGSLMGALVSTESSGDSPEKANTMEEKSWLKEVPVDPWDRPFRVVVIGDRTSYQMEQTSSGYPDEPPAGTAIVVISAGPNGLYDTDLAQLWNADLSGRLHRTDSDNSTPSGNAFGGDDLGFVLSRSALGGNK